MIPLALANLARRVGRIFGALPSGFPDEWQLLPALTVDDAGLLQGEGVTHALMHPSWRYDSLRTPASTPRAVTWHYTATDAGTAASMARRRMEPRAAGDRAASWHLSIETHGGITQMSRLTAGCWHALGAIPGIGAANRTSTGIELVGHGKAFPSAQVRDAARVLAAIVDRYGIQREHAMIEHSKLDPHRRGDPGPVWMKHHAREVLDFAYGR